MAEPLIPVEHREVERSTLRGYGMVWLAAILFAVNGTVAKVVLESGISSLELTQVRSAGAAVGFGLALALVRPASLRVARRELLFLVAFGIAGVALVQWLYFVAIHRLPVGIALLIQYLAPLLVALYARYALHEPVRRRIWAALALALAGLSLIVELWSEGLALDRLGILAALAAAVTLALYILMAERGTRRRDTFSLLFYGFLVASVFWALVQPPWRFPFERLDESVSLLGNLERHAAPTWLLMAFVVLLGTMATFALMVGALRHVGATRVGIVAMLEPVGATFVAWLWLAEALGTAQLVGGGVVLAGILLAQTAR